MTMTKGKAYEIFCFVFAAIVVVAVLYVLITVVIAWL